MAKNVSKRSHWIDVDISSPSVYPVKESDFWHTSNVCRILNRKVQCSHFLETKVTFGYSSHKNMCLLVAIWNGGASTDIVWCDLELYTHVEFYLNLPIFFCNNSIKFATCYEMWISKSNICIWIKIKWNSFIIQSNESLSTWALMFIYHKKLYQLFLYLLQQCTSTLKGIVEALKTFNYIEQKSFIFWNCNREYLSKIRAYKA